MAMKPIRINLSFKEEEKYLYDYVRQNRNSSVFIKDLIEESLRKSEQEANKNNK